MPEVQRSTGATEEGLDFHPIPSRESPCRPSFSGKGDEEMALYYLETSALVKLYVFEPGTERLVSLTASSAGHRFAILALAQVEFRSAIRRQERGGEISPSEADSLIESFRNIRRVGLSFNPSRTPCLTWRWR